MVRVMSPAAREDLLSPVSPHALLAFLTISHDSLATPVRVVSDPVDFVVGGETYRGIPFEVTPVTDEDGEPRSSIKIQNIDRRIGQQIRQAPHGARVALEIRSTADFDLSVVPRVEDGVSAPIYGFRHFEIRDATVSAVMIEASLVLRDYTQSPWPGRSATQSRCPGLFR